MAHAQNLCDHHLFRSCFYSRFLICKLIHAAICTISPNTRYIYRHRQVHQSQHECKLAPDESSLHFGGRGGKIQPLEACLVKERGANDAPSEITPIQESDG